MTGCGEVELVEKLNTMTTYRREEFDNFEKINGKIQCPTGG